MIYAKKCSPITVELYVFDDLVGAIAHSKEGYLTVTLKNAGNYMHLLPLITYVTTTAWSDVMYITEGGVVYGVTNEEWEKIK